MIFLGDYIYLLLNAEVTSILFPGKIVIVLTWNLKNVHKIYVLYGYQ